MATIGSLNIVLGLGTAAFSAGVKQAQGGLGALASSVSSLSGVFGGLTASFDVGAIAGQFKSIVTNSMETIDTQAKLADSLGLTMEAFTSFAHGAKLAGVSQEDFSAAFGKMLDNAGSLGVVGLTAEQAFNKVADSIAAVEDPSKRWNMAVEAFGKSGGKLLPFLSQGSAGFAAMRAEAEKTGVVLSRLDAAKVEAANDAITNVGEAVSGVGNALAVQLAPYITVAAEQFVNLATSGKGAAGYIIDGFEWVVGAIAKASDYANLLTAAFHGFRAGALEALGGVFDAVDWLGSSIVDLMNMLPGVNLEWTSAVSDFRAGLTQVADEEAQKFDDAMNAFHNGDNQKAVGDFFANIRTQADAAAKKIADMNKKNAEALIGPKFVANTADDGIGLMLGNAMKAFDEFAKQGKSVFEATRTPLEKYQAKLVELNDLLAAGAIDQDTFARATEQAQAALDSSGTSQPVQFASLDSSSGAAAAAAEAATLKIQGDAASQKEMQRKQTEAVVSSEKALRELVTLLKVGTV